MYGSIGDSRLQSVVILDSILRRITSSMISCVGCFGFNTTDTKATCMSQVVFLPVSFVLLSNICEPSQLTELWFQNKYTSKFVGEGDETVDFRDKN